MTTRPTLTNNNQPTDPKSGLKQPASCRAKSETPHFDDLDATVIAEFLTSLETSRRVTVSTRNARLAAIRSFFTYAAFGHPEHAATIARVLAIPSQRAPAPLVTFLTPPEIEALINACDTSTWIGRRDRCLLTVGIQTGLRVSELVALNPEDLTLGHGGYLRCVGKGRKQRAVPLNTHTQSTITGWLDEHPSSPLFPRRDGQPLSRDAVRRIVTRRTNTAAATCPGLAAKNITPHVMRHTCAMQLLRAGIDITVIALILGHANLATTNIYLQADHQIKQAAIAKIKPPATQDGNYRPPDGLLAFLEAL
ncbi:MAG: tyrosine-type recombinase/integrase [bacterium]|nr:tyrosine-type recombinase/integrase [bacterium]